MPSEDGQRPWIDGLRKRLAAGELARLAPIDLGDGTGHLRSEVTVKVMLADLADLDDPEGSWGGDAAWREERRRFLLADFRRLRELIG